MPTTRPTITGKGERGYTLTELLLVVLLLGIIVAVAVTSYSGALADIKLDTAAREVQAAFLFAQNQSVNRNAQAGEQFGVEFSPAGNWFRCIQDNGGPTPDVVFHPVDKRPFQVDFDDPGYFQGIALSSVNLDPGDRVYYDSRGTPSVSGSVTLQYSGRQRIITLIWPTGSVTVN